MIHSRKEREKLEAEHLAPYSAKSAQTLGRKHGETRHDYRTDFQRDRDRILYSRAFRRLTKHAPESVDDVKKCPERLVTFSPGMKSMLEPFRAFLFRDVYYQPAVSDANEKAVQMMRSLFLHYIDRPEKMGRKARARVEKEGLWRTVCDYIAGMTDPYAIEAYEKYGLGETG